LKREGSEFVFPGKRGASHISPRSVSKTIERARAKLATSLTVVIYISTNNTKDIKPRLRPRWHIKVNPMLRLQRRGRK
jgi:hypothetical protein